MTINTGGLTLDTNILIRRENEKLANTFTSRTAFFEFSSKFGREILDRIFSSWLATKTELINQLWAKENPT